MSFARNTAKHTATDTYDASESDAVTHRITRTTSFAAYAAAYYGGLLNVRQTARKLVVTESVLGSRFAVPSAPRMK